MLQQCNLPSTVIVIDALEVELGELNSEGIKAFLKRRSYDDRVIFDTCSCGYTTPSLEYYFVEFEWEMSQFGFSFFWWSIFKTL